MLRLWPRHREAEAPGAVSERKRFQVVVSLGEGTRGLEHRRAMEKAASVARKTLSSWCRSVLAAAAGMPGEELVTRADVERLERRLSELEKRLEMKVKR